MFFIPATTTSQYASSFRGRFPRRPLAIWLSVPALTAQMKVTDLSTGLLETAAISLAVPGVALLGAATAEESHPLAEPAATVSNFGRGNWPSGRRGLGWEIADSVHAVDRPLACARSGVGVREDNERLASSPPGLVALAAPLPRAEAANRQCHQFLPSRLPVTSMATGSPTSSSGRRASMQTAIFPARRM